MTTSIPPRDLSVTLPTSSPTTIKSILSLETLPMLSTMLFYRKFRIFVQKLMEILKLTPKKDYKSFWTKERMKFRNSASRKLVSKS